MVLLEVIKKSIIKLDEKKLIILLYFYWKVSHMETFFFTSKLLLEQLRIYLRDNDKWKACGGLWKMKNAGLNKYRKMPAKQLRTNLFRSITRKYMHLAINKR